MVSWFRTLLERTEHGIYCNWGECPALSHAHHHEYGHSPPPRSIPRLKARSGCLGHPTRNFQCTGGRNSLAPHIVARNRLRTRDDIAPTWRRREYSRDLGTWKRCTEHDGAHPRDGTIRGRKCGVADQVRA